MTQNGLLINYEFCTGCHTCEVACRNARNISHGKWGIKLAEIGPFELETDPLNRKWEWTFIPIPTDLCNLCLDRTAEGKLPSCVHHCQAKCMEYGAVEELLEKAKGKGKKISIFIP